MSTLQTFEATVTKDYPVAASSIQVIGSIDLSRWAAGALVQVSAEFQVTTPQPQELPPAPAGYNTLVGSRLSFCDSPTNVLGTLVAPGLGQNVTPEGHHLVTTRFGAALLPTVNRRYLNLIAWFNATRAVAGDVITVDNVKMTSIVHLVIEQP